MSDAPTRPGNPSEGKPRHHDGRDGDAREGVTIVTPWFGSDAPGGAERLARSLAERLAWRGWRATLATTTNGGHHGWWEESNHSAGAQPWPGDTDTVARAESAGGKLLLRRFPPDPRHRRRYDAINYKFLHREPILLAEEEQFFRNSINSRALLSWVAAKRPNDLVLALPYPFGLSFFATALFAKRAVLVPCLHREGYAMARLVAEMLERAGGLIFLSPEERALAEALADIAASPSVVAGVGVDEEGAGGLPEPPGDERRAEARARFADGESYVLCLGWQDASKGIGFLYECWQDVLRAAREGGLPKPPRLLLAGPGHVPMPPSLAGRAFNLGYLPPEEKRFAIAGAEWLVQPSQHESFSIVLMEAWLAGVPALVSALCAPTRGHVARAKGGLWFANGEELAGAIAWGRANGGLKAKMGEAGRAYVLANYQWDPLIDRVDRFLLERQAALRAGAAAGV